MSQGFICQSASGPQVDEVLAVSPALSVGEYEVSFAVSSNNGLGEVNLEIYRNLAPVILLVMYEQNRGVGNLSATVNLLDQDVLRIVSKSAISRKVTGTIVWKQVGP